MRHIIKYFLIGITATLLIIFSQGGIKPAGTASFRAVAQNVNLRIEQQEQARSLTLRGHKQLEQGQPEAALQTWQAATQLYRQLHNQEGVSGSLINQSLALQTIGQYPRACTTLTDALELESAICPSPLHNLTSEQIKVLVQQALSQQPPTAVQVLGLHNLGDTLRQLSQPENSATVLQQSLAITQRLPQLDTSGLLLSLGNTDRTFYSRAKALYANQDAAATQQSEVLRTIQEKSHSALAFYQKAAENSRSATTVLSARLNILALLTDVDIWTASQARYQVTELQALHQEVHPRILPLVQQIQTADFSQLSALESANARLNFASSLLGLAQSSDPKLSQTANLGFEAAQAALRTGKNLSNYRFQSSAAGTLGRLYQSQGDSIQAQQQFAAAMGWAQSIQAWDLAYQWQEKLGHMYQQSGDRARATDYFRAAVSSLEQVRGQLLSVDPELQFSFKEKVEPVYQQYMRLLFDSKEPNYEEILQVNEQLRLAELENYLQCGKLNLVSPAKLKGNRPTFIYVLNLGDRFEEIVLSPDGKMHRHRPDVKTLSDNANLFLTYLNGDTLASTPETAYLPYAQALYDQLITPIKAFIPNSGTLVFSLDTTLQSIPMDLLYDGESYLFEHYSTALTLGSQIQPPQALPRQKLDVLLAGVTQASPSFQSPKVPAGLEPLPGVQTEIDAIRKLTASNKELLNQTFTREQFQEAVNSNSFPIIHVATHGQFSSDPNQTLILAWDNPINISQFSTLLNGRNGDQLSLELLTLSACETAQGDKRSALGLAGVAVQSGARSTLASLWLVDEASTAELMAEFYKNLQAGLPKAEAKRQAQLTLRRNPQTANPYLWGSFVLVGGWL